MRQRHESLAPASPLNPNVILDDRAAAGKAMLISKSLEYPLGRVPLLHRGRSVRFQDPSITGINGPSFGFSGGRWRTYPGGIENRHIFETVSRLNPKTRAASRRLLPALKTNRRTATTNIPSSRGRRNALPLAGFYSAAVANRAPQVASFVTAAHSQNGLTGRRSILVRRCRNGLVEPFPAGVVWRVNTNRARRPASP
jgi:hypothetical protein